MAEVVGLAASIMQIAGAGTKLSLALYNFTSSAARADQDIRDIADDVNLTSNTLESVGRVFEMEDAKSIVSKKAVQDANNIIKKCEDVFKELEDIIEKRRKLGKDGKKTLSMIGKLSWPMKEQRVELNRRRLESLKNSLVLLLHVLQLAQGQAWGKIEKSVIEEEREKIRKLHQTQQESLKSLQALEKKFCNIALDDEETLRGSTTNSRVATIDLMLNPIPSGVPPLEKTTSQASTNIITVDLSTTNDSDTSDSDATVTDDDDDDDDDEHLSVEELAKCAKHAQKLLKRITLLQQTFESSQKTGPHRKKRVHKLYQRFCQRFESDIINKQPVPLLVTTNATSPRSHTSLKITQDIFGSSHQELRKLRASGISTSDKMRTQSQRTMSARPAKKIAGRLHYQFQSSNTGGDSYNKPKSSPGTPSPIGIAHDLTPLPRPDNFHNPFWPAPLDAVEAMQYEVLNLDLDCDAEAGAEVMCHRFFDGDVENYPAIEMKDSGDHITSESRANHHDNVEVGRSKVDQFESRTSKEGVSIGAVDTTSANVTESNERLKERESSAPRPSEHTSISEESASESLKDSALTNANWSDPQARLGPIPQIPAIQAPSPQQKSLSPLTDTDRMNMTPTNLDPAVKEQLLKVPEHQFLEILKHYTIHASKATENEQAAIPFSIETSRPSDHLSGLASRSGSLLDAASDSSVELESPADVKKFSRQPQEATDDFMASSRSHQYSPLDQPPSLPSIQTQHKEYHQQHSAVVLPNNQHLPSNQFEDLDCTSCQAQDFSCSGGQPCSRCTEDGIKCIYTGGVISPVPIKEDTSTMSRLRRRKVGRRCGPLAPAQREQAHAIRKIGSCVSCRALNRKCGPTCPSYIKSQAPKLPELCENSREVIQSVKFSGRPSLFSPSVGAEHSSLAFSTGSAHAKTPSIQNSSSSRYLSPLPPPVSTPQTDLQDNSTNFVAQNSHQTLYSVQTPTASPVESSLRLDFGSDANLENFDFDSFLSAPVEVDGESTFHVSTENDYLAPVFDDYAQPIHGSHESSQRPRVHPRLAEDNADVLSSAPGQMRDAGYIPTAADYYWNTSATISNRGGYGGRDGYNTNVHGPSRSYDGFIGRGGFNGRDGYSEANNPRSEIVQESLSSSNVQQRPTISFNPSMSLHEHHARRSPSIPSPSLPPLPDSQFSPMSLLPRIHPTGDLQNPTSMSRPRPSLSLKGSSQPYTFQYSSMSDQPSLGSLTRESEDAPPPLPLRCPIAPHGNAQDPDWQWGNTNSTRNTGFGGSRLVTAERCSHAQSESSSYTQEMCSPEPSDGSEGRELLNRVPKWETRRRRRDCDVEEGGDEDRDLDVWPSKRPKFRHEMSEGMGGAEGEQGGEERDIVDVLLEQWTVPVY